MTRHLSRAPFVALLLVAAQSLSAQENMIIYRDGRILVRRVIPVAVPVGRSEHFVEFDQFDPSSLVALDSGVTLLEVRYPRSVSEEALLRASVGRRLVFERESGTDTVSALVLGEDPPRFDLGGGQISLRAPGAPRFPRELTGTARRTLLVVNSRRALPRLALAYMSTGVTWMAEYALMLSGGSARVSGRMVLHSSGVRADSMGMSVLEGQVNRVSRFQRQQGNFAAERAGFAVAQPFQLEEIVTGAVQEAEPMAVPTPEAISGFRVYAVQGRHSLEPGKTTVIPLFDPVSVPVEKVHLVAGLGARVVGGESPLPVLVQYRVPRSRETPFGANPLPPGFARLFGNLAEGVILVGEATVDRAEPGKTLELSAGAALDVTARRMPEQRTAVQDTSIGIDGRRQVVSVAMIQDVLVRFANASDSTVAIELTEPIGVATVVRSSVPPTAPAPGTLLFRIRIPPRDSAAVSYRLRMQD